MALRWPNLLGRQFSLAKPGLSHRRWLAGASPSDDNFLDLSTLVQRLKEQLPAQPAVGAPISGEVVAKVTETLQNAKLNPREWRQHAIFRRGRYTRNIVGYSPNQFVALLLCWERGQQSPIHDHSGAHCFIKMLSGQLREVRFAWTAEGCAGAELKEEPATMDAAIPAQSVGFMHDSLGLHRIENPSHDEVAISLHIYSPPFRECLVFPPTGAAPRTAPMVSIFSPETAWNANGQREAEVASEPASTSLQDFCSTLATLKTAEDMNHAVLDALVPAEMTAMEWASYASPAHFSEFHPVQHIIHCDDDFSVVMTCWSPGQKVPPHTVGRGRKMWMKVMHGKLTHQEYAPGLFPWESDVERKKELAEGSASIMEECSVRMHDLTNFSDSEPAVSVQVFSPPLTQFTFHSEMGTERRCLPRLVEGNSEGRSVSARSFTRTAGRWYLSFGGLRGLLNEEFSRPDISDGAISALLCKAVFNPEEWRERLAALTIDRSESPATPKYVLLAEEKAYSVVLTFWGNSSEEQCVKRERKTGRSWTLILEGELEERAFAQGEHGPVLLRSSTLKEDSLSFLSDKLPGLQELAGGAWVERSHESDTPCVSLHVYHPTLEEE